MLLFSLFSFINHDNKSTRNGVHSFESCDSPWTVGVPRPQEFVKNVKIKVPFGLSAHGFGFFAPAARFSLSPLGLGARHPALS